MKLLGRIFRWIAQTSLAVLILFDLYMAPYSKVEESFHVQATFDLLYGSKTMDHELYPGVVPRSFVGAALLATVVQIVRWILSGIFALQFVNHPLVLQFGVRACLGLICWCGFCRIASVMDEYQETISTRKTKSKVAGTYFLVLTMVQFHSVFYASRLLSNIFAMAMTLYMIQYWIMLRKQHIAAFLLVMAAALFRCDLLLLLFTCGLSWLFTKQLTILQALIIGIGSGILALCLSVPLDSHLWGYWVWPEGQVFYFNVVEGKSVDWGTSPWHWYFTSALPKSLLVAFPLAIYSLSIPKLRKYSLPAFGFVVLYSFVEHKEVRFLFPALPVFNLCAAVSLSHIHDRATATFKDKNPSAFYRLLYFFCFCGILASAMISRTFALLSYRNYPGGDAMNRLVDYVRRQKPTGLVRVYIDVASAMSGVSLYSQQYAQESTPGVQWEFFKEGYETQNQIDSYDDFDFFLSEKSDVLPGYDVIQVAQGNPRLEWREWHISTENAVYVLQKKSGSDLDSETKG